MTKQSVLTPAGERFISDILQDFRECEDDYFMQDLCADWGVKDVSANNLLIPDDYKGYGTITAVDVPLILKSNLWYTDLGYTTPEIRMNPRNTYPYFHNEIFGEVSIWNEVQRRGKPHTDVFAPVYQHDTDFEWLIAGFATDIRRENLRSAREQVEERGRTHGWAPDDTEVGLFNEKYVAIDYGKWWRQNDDWMTNVTEYPYVDESTLNGPEEPLSDERVTSELHDHATPSNPDERDKLGNRGSTAATHRESAPETKRSRIYRWLTSLMP